MTQDYRKRAEELILRLGIAGEIRIAGETACLAEAFQQVAQEAVADKEKEIERLNSIITNILTPNRKISKIKGLVTK